MQAISSANAKVITPSIYSSIIMRSLRYILKRVGDIREP